MRGPSGDPAAATDWRAAAARLRPPYGEASLADLLPSVCAHLGVPGCSDVLGLPATDRACVLLVDALGWHLLRRHPETAPLLHELAEEGRLITAGFPTTTPTSLACLGTGLAPGGHGLVGFQVLVPGPERVMNLLTWDEGVDPVAFQPSATLMQRAEASGVTVTTVGPRAYRGTGLTVAALRGGVHRGGDSIGELVAGITAALAEPGPALVYAYYPGLDQTGHRNGCDSPAWLAELSVVDHMVGLLREALPSGAVLYVTGDHGMVDVPLDRRIDMATEPALREGVALVAGEPRVVYLRTVCGATSDVMATWRDRLGSDFWVLPTEEVIELGWYGAVRDGVAARIGDIVVAARVPAVSIVDSERTPRGLLRLKALHGSLTDHERHVPLLTLRG
ncbi:MAG TPA: alkaline phosphatase family protein [Actinomycetes bacterium]|nr:alkaline phosphatase family protein [Actinomycetes bacterium]